MKIVIIGGTGFIGSYLYDKLSLMGHQPFVCSRRDLSAETCKEYKIWDGQSVEQLYYIIKDVDAVINLAGENIASGRWTKARKEKILNSRLNVTQALAEVLKQPTNAKIIIQGSASGYYGYYNDMQSAPHSTESSVKGDGFLAEVCEKWESAIRVIDTDKIRLCIMRTAPVLGNGGMLDKMLPLYWYGLGGVVGSGNQPFSWIHIDDMASAIVHLINNDELQGVFNMSAPYYSSMRELAKTIGKVINKPVILPIPGMALKLLYGQMADEMILNGQIVIPKALEDSGFKYKYPKIELALKNILKNM